MLAGGRQAVRGSGKVGVRMTGSRCFDTGALLRCIGSGFSCSVTDYIGAGGQGEVYEVTLGGTRYAVKWYHAHVLELDRRLRGRLSRAIERGSPDDRFLWPIELLEASGRDSFGYLMPLRPGHFRSMRDLIAAPPRRVFPSLRTRAAICMGIAESFLQLHAKGLCYQDINFGNLFIEPASGEICICDNDNVDVNGAPASVYGTRKFMAPEVVRREKLPDATTDLYSMAVLFFYVIQSWHPLDGKAEAAIPVLETADEFRLYGSMPRFLFDPDDDSNGPLAGYHDGLVLRWRSLSAQIRGLFIRAFTDGLAADGGARVVETEWRSAMARLRDTVIACPQCGFEHALDADDADESPDRLACIACRTPIVLPPRLQLGREVALLGPGATLFPHHLDPARPFDFSCPTASVSSHPGDPAVSGLRNLTMTPWAARFPTGLEVTVEPGRTVRLVDRLELDFGRRRGRVVV